VSGSVNCWITDWAGKRHVGTCWTQNTVLTRSVHHWWHRLFAHGTVKWQIARQYLTNRHNKTSSSSSLFSTRWTDNFDEAKHDTNVQYSYTFQCCQWPPKWPVQCQLGASSTLRLRYDRSFFTVASQEVRGHPAAFLQRVSIACYAERCISYGKSVRPSVWPSVPHTLALSQNDSSYDHGVFTGG